METRRSPFRKIIDYRIFFAFLVLLTMGALVESVTDLTTGTAPAAPGTTQATKNGKKIWNNTTVDALATMTTVPTPASETTSTLPLTTPDNKHSTSLLSSLPSKQPPLVTVMAPTHGKKTSALDVVTITTTTVSHTDKEPLHKLTTNTSDRHTSADQKASDTQTGAATPSETSATTAVSNVTTVVPKPHWTSGELTTSHEITPTPKSLRPRSKGHPGESTEKGQTTTPRQDVPVSTQTPDKSHDGGISEDLSTETGKTTVVSGTTTALPNLPKKPSVALIIAIVLLLLLALALLLACLYCRRRRRSGSTSFNSGGWAGQASVPDDTGLDKDEEQGPLTTGEGETRRATLTTFFGKRQSRASSIAMEEIDGKKTERREETQQLIDGNAGRDSSPQGPGEANGKGPQPTQEETPPTPTKVE